MSFVDNTTYAGKDLPGFYSKALLLGNTKENITIYPNVKSKVKIASLDLDNIVQADGCDFEDQGTSTLAQKTLEVCPLKINLQYCTLTFEANYLSEQLRAGSNQGEVMPTSTSDYIVGQVMKHVNAFLEKLIWQGDVDGSPANGPMTLCDGLLKKFDADGDVVKINNTTITTSNVIAELTKVYEGIPDELYDGMQELKWFIPVGVAKIYKQVVAAASAETYYVKDAELSFLGIQMIVTKGMPANTMVCAAKENLWMGTDLMSDLEDIKIINLYDTLGEKKVRLVGGFKFGVNYGVSEEVVYYGAA